METDVVRVPQAPPSLPQAPTGKQPRLQELEAYVDSFTKALGAAADGTALAAQGQHYLHWDELRHRPPPAPLDSKTWWHALKLGRRFARKALPFADVSGRQAWYTLPDVVMDALQFVDSRLGGHIAANELITDRATRDRYLVSALMEEAISSSLLEGAATTYREAKELLRTGRAPRNDGERMVNNNLRAMQYVIEHQQAPITMSRIHELHRILTLDVINPPDAAGRFRRGDENVRVWDKETHDILHTPPPAKDLPDRMARLVSFTNGDSAGGFCHPVARAITTHYWLGYDHPFVDGNGRVARALFFWVMLKSGYWLTQFISISSIARRAPIAYAQAYLLAETDESDVTYFLVQQLDALRKAIKALDDHLKRKQQELHEVDKLLRTDVSLNHRQMALLSHALRNAETVYTIESHGTSHRVVYATSRADLLDLARRGLLGQRKVGRRFQFRPMPDLESRIRKLKG